MSDFSDSSVSTSGENSFGVGGIDSWFSEGNNGYMLPNSILYLDSNK